MATLVWRGDAPAVSQVTTWAFGGTWEATDLVKVTINGKTVSVTADSTLANTVIDNVAAALTALSAALHPEFAEIAWSRSGGNLVGTAVTAGQTFTAAVTTTESDGGSADGQTIGSATLATASAAPNDWSTAGNWSTGAVPVDGDDVHFEHSSIDVLYGLNQSGVQLASLRIGQSYTGKIGLPRTSDAGYIEYRAAYLAIGAAVIHIGDGVGAGSSRIKLDTGADQTALHIHDAGSPAESDLESVLWKGTHADNVINLSKGSLGVAVLPSETATIATLNLGYRDNVIGDATARLGSGVTLTTINKSGGALEINSNLTTLTQTDGETTIAAGAVTTLNVRGGAVRYNSTGACGTANVAAAATLDFSRDLRAKTVTTTNKYGDGRVRDPFKVVTFTNGIDCEESDLSTLELGSHVNIARAATS